MDRKLATYDVLDPKKVATIQHTLGKMADGVERRGALAEAGAALSAGSSDGVIPTDKYLELFRQLGAFLRSLGSVRCNTAHV